MSDSAPLHYRDIVYLAERCTGSFAGDTGMVLDGGPTCLVSTTSGTITIIVPDLFHHAGHGSRYTIGDDVRLILRNKFCASLRLFEPKGNVATKAELSERMKTTFHQIITETMDGEGAGEYPAKLNVPVSAVDAKGSAYLVVSEAPTITRGMSELD